MDNARKYWDEKYCVLMYLRAEVKDEKTEAKYIEAQESFINEIINKEKNMTQLSPMLNLVKMMHQKFGISSDKIAFSHEEKEFRIAAMREEIEEYENAIHKNREQELDALIDLVVFAIGTAERMGWLDVFEEGFNRVMVANLAKEVGKNQKRGNFALDLVKPDGWKPAELSDLVANESMSQMSLFDYINHKK